MNNCKKCNNQGYTSTLYRDGHEDVHMCDCEHNIFRQRDKFKKALLQLEEILLDDNSDKICNQRNQAKNIVGKVLRETKLVD